MQIFSWIIIILGIILLISNLFKFEALSMPWLKWLFISTFIIVLGICFLDIFTGFKNIAIILLVFIGMGAIMKSRLNLVQQIIVNTLLVVLGVSIIAIINA